jgi:hypothetical protein
VWGLTDVPFTIPWVGVSVSRHLWANAPWDSITLRVGSSAAVTKDIVRAYQLACGRGWTESGQKTRAPRGPWRMRVVAFVDRQRGLNPKATWGDIFDAFVTEWPDQPYGSMRSFRQAFYLGQRTTERSTP